MLYNYITMYGAKNIQETYHISCTKGTGFISVV